jgi:hypothetical protein
MRKVRDKRSWMKVEEVMSYFGDYMNIERADMLVREIKGKSFFDSMNRIRDILLEEEHSVPFRSVYKRIGD